jgi:hypothetical protein
MSKRDPDATALCLKFVFSSHPSANEGKSGGYRSIILFRRGERAFFVYGFAKNDQDNIDQSDERDSRY